MSNAKVLHESIEEILKTLPPETKAFHEKVIHQYEAMSSENQLLMRTVMTIMSIFGANDVARDTKFDAVQYTLLLMQADLCTIIYDRLMEAKDKKLDIETVIAYNAVLILTDREKLLERFTNIFTVFADSIRAKMEKKTGNTPETCERCGTGIRPEGGHHCGSCGRDI